jgi:hypothetical protein
MVSIELVAGGILSILGVTECPMRKDSRRKISIVNALELFITPLG